MESAVEQFKFQLRASNLKASPVYFSVEPKLGIPFARNHVLDVAARIGCDFLAFTDDDCRVSPDWITRLLEAQQKDDADLTANHVHLAVDFNGLRYAQKMLAQGWLHGQGKPCIFVTANWMVKTSFLAAHSLRFDENLGFDPEEDRQFYHDLLSAGGRYCWAPKAHVEETITSDRLTFMFLFRRSRAHQLARSCRKQPGFIRLICNISYALCLTPFRMLLIPQRGLIHLGR